MRERDYYTPIGKYYTKTATVTTPWEAKLSRTKYINFRCLAPHQEERLLQSERRLNYKFPDEGRGLKPFDGVCIVMGKPMFIAIYYRPNDTKIYEIPLRAFLKEKYESGEKSLHEDRAKEIGKEIFLS